MPIVMYRFIVLGITTVAVVMPLSLVVYQSFLTAPFFDPSAKMGFLAYPFVFADDDFWQAFWTTITIAGGMAAIAVPLGALLAFLMVRTDVPGKRYLEPLLLTATRGHSVMSSRLVGYEPWQGPIGVNRNGVLVFVSLAERYARIIADEGIAAKVHNADWQAAIDALTGHLRNGRIAEGFAAAIERCGAVLQAHAPPDGSPSELPNRLYVM